MVRKTFSRSTICLLFALSFVAENVDADQSSARFYPRSRHARPVNDASILAGPLEYELGTGNDHQTGFAAQGVFANSRLEAIQESFNNPKAPLHTSSETPLENRNPAGCALPWLQLRSASTALQAAITALTTSMPEFVPLVGPVSALAVLPDQSLMPLDVTLQLRMLNYGLLSFEYATLYLSVATKLTFSSVAANSKTVMAYIENLLGCFEVSSLFDLTASSSVTPMTCAAVQELYDGYIGVVQKAAQTAKELPSVQVVALEEAMSLLRFQSSGVFLSNQGAEKAIEQLESDPYFTNLKTVTDGMRFALGAGDALQACQKSMVRRALVAAQNYGSAQDFEHVVRNVLWFGSHRSPLRASVGNELAGAAGTNSCVEKSQALQNHLSVLVTAIGEASPAPKLSSRVSMSIHQRLLARMSDTIGDLGSLVSPDLALRELMVSTAALIRTLDFIPTSQFYEVMMPYVNDIKLIYPQLSSLYQCVLATLQNGKGTSHEVRCQTVTLFYRDLLEESMEGADQYASAISSADVELFKSRIKRLAKVANLWDSVHSAVVKDIDRELWVGRVHSSTSQMLLGAEFVAQLHGSSELMEMISLLRNTANILEGCVNAVVHFDTVGNMSEGDIDDVVNHDDRDEDGLHIYDENEGGGEHTEESEDDFDYMDEDASTHMDGDLQCSQNTFDAKGYLKDTKDMPCRI